MGLMLSFVQSCLNSLKLMNIYVYIQVLFKKRNFKSNVRTLLNKIKLVGDKIETEHKASISV